MFVCGGSLVTAAVRADATIADEDRQQGQQDAAQHAEKSVCRRSLRHSPLLGGEAYCSPDSAAGGALYRSDRSVYSPAWRDGVMWVPLT